ncbi:MAG: N-acetyl-1-D-myo-inositol-2-amino-2-deoxy-alpha-D-glucopyranoside deacetylase [Ornithinimicrobium sp.]|uniref:N-acetyl-1-D-myo-inositol-2-amino-2-deoxy-alpha- D-glucopyranoside deacetylase n=1 Tax=Ornithinimicrobium sp. TaxID=1977084 RepID=UPI0026DED926|nr:N-acetyl-1-D-myo-inositol-2-amino-2-deoxy-alpha-D-glucopyranoside deacetylase [Ornithinimicrobium sp.]MDO5739087.1 N-acetyl-1-D-myo-inositol-2-amino-2-deoxy-alpha-D-glucopyranoside deacetylase [Ornithinimicrobium sp.]
MTGSSEVGSAARRDLRDGIPADLRRPLRLLAVHAHPDDETLATGLTLAHHASAGDEVHVLTCTLGEEGEVITPELSGLEGTEELGPHRALEVARATSILGVTHHWLGGDPPRWRDSGMAGSAAAAHPRAFVNADVQQAAQMMAEQIRALRPDVVVTYDPEGGYGHPDHIHTHRVTMAAVGLLSAPERPVTYVVLIPRAWAEQDRAWLAEHVPSGTRSPAGGVARVPAPEEPYAVGVVDDDKVTHAVQDPAAAVIQASALREHGTQVTVHEGWYTLSNDVAARISGREGFARWETGQW